MHIIIMGIVLGLSAGITPGPLVALVLSESVQHGTSAGIKAAVGPVLSDLPIVLLSVTLVAHVSQLHIVLGGLSLAGACFLAFLGLQNFRSTALPAPTSTPPTGSFRKGFIANALNPHPYLFWFTVGAPIAARALTQHKLWLVAFLASFYLAFAGVKILLAVVAGRFRTFFNPTVYTVTVRLLGAALCALSLALLRSGLHLLTQGG